MQTKPRIEHDSLNGIWAIYDPLLNRGKTDQFLKSTHGCDRMTFNGRRTPTPQNLAEAYMSLRAALPYRQFRLDRVSFDFDIAISPETFANIANVWWIVEPSPEAVGGGYTVYGATKITFRDDGSFIESRDIWSPTS